MNPFQQPHSIGSLLYLVVGKENFTRATANYSQNIHMFAATCYYITWKFLYQEFALVTDIFRKLNCSQLAINSKLYIINTSNILMHIIVAKGCYLRQMIFHNISTSCYHSPVLNESEKEFCGVWESRLPSNQEANARFYRNLILWITTQRTSK